MNKEDQQPTETAKKSEKDTRADNLKHLHKNGRHYVRCETCFSNPIVSSTADDQLAVKVGEPQMLSWL